MLWFSKRKKIKENPALREMDGREVKYVTRMYRDESGEQKSIIVGKAGRIVLIDDEIAYVGTTNLDFRSLLHHYECGVIIYNSSCLKDIDANFENDYLKILS